jgi:multicomponent Na+:H+ antiporter subunit D
MTSLWLTLPMVSSLLTAIWLFTIRHSTRLLMWCSVLSALFNLFVSVQLLVVILDKGPQALALGQWQAPFGIVFVADYLTAAMVLVTAIIGLACVVYAIADLRHKTSCGVYHALFYVLLAGVYGAFLTGDLFNLYVWFEVILIASFGLMILDANSRQIDGAVKYVMLNLIATLVFLLAIGLLYGATGTLNLADLHAKAAFIDSQTQALLAALFLFAFAIKAALFPLFAWLPAAYHTLPAGVVALFAALLTKVGVYALMRLFTLVFPLTTSGWQPLMLVVAGLTMLTGVLGAAAQLDIKRILSFHIISQIGYMIMGLALHTPPAIAGAIFYVIHHIIVKANLFLIGGYLERTQGSSQLAHLGNAYQLTPGLAFLFLIPAFSLAGFPPLSGFWGKYVVIKESLTTGHYLLAATALLVGLLTLFSMSKIWSEAFWKPAPENQYSATLDRQTHLLYYLPIISLTSLSLLIGLAAEPFFRFSLQASEQLLIPDAYIAAVLGGAP